MGTYCELRFAYVSCVDGYLWLPTASSITRTDEGCDDKNEFKCTNGECIDNRYRCDGEVDCSDDSDEHSCACDGVNDFKCSNGDCIGVEWKCDGEPDCSDESDEKNCN